VSCSCAEGGGESPEERLSVRLAVGGEEPQGRRLGLVGVAGAAGAPALERSQMSARARLGRGAARCGVSAAQRGGGGGGGGGGGRARHAPARRASSLSRRRATVFCRAACSARLDSVTGPGVRGMVGMRKAVRAWAGRWEARRRRTELESDRRGDRDERALQPAWWRLQGEGWFHGRGLQGGGVRGGELAQQPVPAERRRRALPLA